MAPQNVNAINLAELLTDDGTYEDLAIAESAASEEPSTETLGIMYGVAKNGSGVVALVRNFKPSLYVQLPDGANAVHADALSREVERVSHLKRGSVDVKLVHKHKLYGWYSSPQNPSARRLFTWARLTFQTCKAARSTGYALERKDVDLQDGVGQRRLVLANAKVDAVQQMLAQCGARASGWCRVQNFELAPLSSRCAPFVQVELSVDVANVKPLEDEQSIARLLIACTDIETDSSTGAMSHARCVQGKCPPGCTGDPVIFIGVSVYAYGDTPKDKGFHPVARYMLCLGPVDPVEGMEVRCFATELDLLKGWRDLVVSIDVDWLTSYNGTGFDYKYLSDRHELLRSHSSRFLHTGKLIGDVCTLQERRLSSNAYGDNLLHAFNMRGRVGTDLFLYAKTSFKLSSFKLDAVAREFIPATSGKVVLGVEGWVPGAIRKAQLLVSQLVGAEHPAAKAMEAAAALAVVAPKREAKDQLVVVAVAGGAGDEEEDEEDVDEDEEHPAYKELHRAIDALQNVKADADLVQATRKALREATVATGSDNYKKLFAINRMGPAERAAIAKYAMVDCDLALELMITVNVVPNMLQMSNVTHTLLHDIGNRGQQIKVFNQLYRYSLLQNYVMNPPVCGWPEDLEYEGAFVIPPKKGYYTDPVTCLDFASLYPSIILYKNLCMSTLCIQPAPPQLQPHTETHEIGGVPWTFVKHEKGVLPQILDSLLLARKQTRTLQKSVDKKSLEWSLLEGRQLALKVSANSCYGFMGVQKNGMYPCMPVAAAVTSTGRGMIKKTRDFVEERNGVVVYGDSVSGDTALIVRNPLTGFIGTRRIDELHLGSWGEHRGGKEAAAVVVAEGQCALQVWSDTGFTAVKRIIRHLHAKPLHRVLTRIGVVDCTADHSLLRPDGTEVSPVDLQLGAELMHVLLPTLDCAWEKMTCSRAHVMGLFTAHGSYHLGRWRIVHTDLHLLKRVQNGLPFESQLLDADAAPGVALPAYMLSAVSALVAQEYKQLCYNRHGEKRVPDHILNASMDIAQAFFNGVLGLAASADLPSASGTASADMDYARGRALVVEGKELCMGLWLLAGKLGITSVHMGASANLSKFTLGTSPDKSDGRITFMSTHFSIGDDAVAAASGERLVYDLETASHHFHVGPGHMVVHNTDSIMYTVPRQSMPDAFAMGNAMAKGATALFALDGQVQGPVKLEFEKVMNPYLLCKKKNYACLKYESLEGKPKLESKGMANVRRDNASMVRTLMNGVLRAVMVDKDPLAAYNLVAAKLRDLERNAVPIGELTITMSLKSEDVYVDASMHAQVTVSRKMVARGAFDAPRAGDRVPFVIIESKEPKISQRAEQPSYAQSQGMPLDRVYYTESLRTPVLKIMELLPVPSVEELFANTICELARQRAGLPQLTDFFGEAPPARKNAQAATGSKRQLTNAQLVALAKRQKVASAAAAAEEGGATLFDM